VSQVPSESVPTASVFFVSRRLSPVVTADKKSVYQSGGPSKYDPRYNQDGKSAPLVLPPAYGLAQVKNETYTAEGPISYWNVYVAVTDGRAGQLL